MPLKSVPSYAMNSTVAPRALAIAVIRSMSSPPPFRSRAIAPAIAALRQPRALHGWWPKSLPSPIARGWLRSRSAAASRMCSQLSTTNNRTLPSNAAATDSLTLLPGCWEIPRIAATASGTAARSVTAANSKTHTPSGDSAASCAPTSSARRVLPTPPTPVNVTSRRDCTAAAISVTSASRPTKLVTRGSQVPWYGVQRPQGRKVRPKARRLQLKHRDRVRQVSQSPRPQAHQIHSP